MHIFKICEQNFENGKIIKIQKIVGICEQKIKMQTLLYFLKIKINLKKKMAKERKEKEKQKRRKEKTKKKIKMKNKRNHLHIPEGS